MCLEVSLIKFKLLWEDVLDLGGAYDWNCGSLIFLRQTTHSPPFCLHSGIWFSYISCIPPKFFEGDQIYIVVQV
jgi:hypothetical protein